eukprot:CAMPEP_0170629362 /NCGR_PEP_ID=MMETSP0224-20130122/33308_1 /TAXON_ID=285029 /ORGANISM="Togula jolla, Strain CCCM 725" /LENGTH=104 /DNA_ID=CAMNT_0010957111 /DNA_START=164 /DNA_END=474 /DNA_ORIENTATION=+
MTGHTKKLRISKASTSDAFFPLRRMNSDGSDSSSTSCTADNAEGVPLDLDHGRPAEGRLLRSGGPTCGQVNELLSLASGQSQAKLRGLKAATRTTNKVDTTAGL